MVFIALVFRFEIRPLNWFSTSVTVAQIVAADRWAGGFRRFAATNPAICIVFESNRPPGMELGVAHIWKLIQTSIVRACDAVNQDRITLSLSLLVTDQTRDFAQRLDRHQWRKRRQGGARKRHPRRRIPHADAQPQF